MWSLTTSEAIQNLIKEKYKQQRHNDDENQPLSVQQWGSDGGAYADKRQYFLVQGQDDTGFRVYREGSKYTRNANWRSVAGDIDELKELAKKLEEVDGSQAARRLAGRMTNAIPTFEATEEVSTGEDFIHSWMISMLTVSQKRRRREYRQIRRAAFTRPEPGFSLYEGRTRGKRMRYTYDEDDAFSSDATSTRRSARQSTRNTPFESGPKFTASGRQSRQPRTGDYGETLLSGAPISMDELAPEHSDADGVTPRGGSGTEDSEQPVRGGGRAMRSGGRQAVNGVGNPRKRKHIDTYNDIDEMSGEEDADASGEEWDSDENDADDDKIPDADDEDDQMSDADDESEIEDVEPQSLVVKLKVPPKGLLDDRRLENGTPSLPNAVDDSTQAGPPKCPPSEGVSTKPVAPAIKAEVPQQQQRLASSPTGPSAYPTPTSSSFLPPEQKPTVAAVPTHPALLPHAGNPGFTNGMTAKMEHNTDGTKAMPQTLPPLMVNGVQSAGGSNSKWL